MNSLDRDSNYIVNEFIKGAKIGSRDYYRNEFKKILQNGNPIAIPFPSQVNKFSDHLQGYGITNDKCDFRDNVDQYLHITLFLVKETYKFKSQPGKENKNGGVILMIGMPCWYFSCMWSVEIFLNKNFTHWSFEGMDNYKDNNYISWTKRKKLI